MSNFEVQPRICRAAWAALTVALLSGVACTAPQPSVPPVVARPTTLVASLAEALPTVTTPAATPTPATDHGPAASAEVLPTATAERSRAADRATATPEPSAAPRVAPTPVVTASPASVPPGATRPRTVALDPGHGGDEVGAASGGYGEKTANLDIALRLKRLLEEEGYRVVLTRDSDRRAFVLPDDQVENPRSIVRADLQARIDIANAARADIFVSIHNNGSGDPGQSGTEVWYDPNRPFAKLNLALAQETLAALVAEIRAAGHADVNRGIKDDATFRVFQGRAFPIFVLGPAQTSPTPTRATNMPAILGETLFLSNLIEAQLLRRDDIQEAIARGYRNGIQRYFQRLDVGELGQSYP